MEIKSKHDSDDINWGIISKAAKKGLRILRGNEMWQYGLKTFNIVEGSWCRG